MENGNVSVEEATGLEDSEGYSWEPGLRKSFQAGEKYGGGRGVVRNGFVWQPDAS